MNSGLFLKGFLVGFLIAMPVGPIGVLCIQRTLHKGKLHGMVSGLGAATADAIYGFIAAFGLTVYFKLFSQRTTVASPCWRHLSLLYGSEGISIQIVSTNRLREWHQLCQGLCVRVYSYLHKSDNISCFRSSICGIGISKHD